MGVAAKLRPSRLLRAARWLPRLRRQVWRLEGTEAGSGESLSVLCAAGAQTRNYLAHLLFDKGTQELDLGRQWLWQLSRVRWVRKRGCALVLIQADPFLRQFLDQDGWFLIPLWVMGTTALPIPDDVLKSKSIRSDVRVIRRTGLRTRVTREADCFDEFYHRMYVPHVTKAHGSSVYVNPYDTMRARLADSDLVMVNDGERDVAGMMIVYDEDRPRLWSAGVRDGDRRYLEQGALTALYHFACQHLTEKNYGSVSLGLSRAFLNDGVLRYKRKWAHTLVGTAPARIALKVVADTAASKSFLRNNPFIFEESGALYGAVFLSEEDPVTKENVGRLKRQYFHDGLSQLILFSPRPGVASHELALPTGVIVEPIASAGERIARD